MKKRFSMLLVLAMTMGLVASGCGNKEESKETVGKDKVVAQKEEKEGKKVAGGSVVRAMPTDISSLNILYETGDEGMTMLKPVYDPLYVVSKDEVRLSSAAILFGRKQRGIRRRKDNHCKAS